MPHSVYDKEKIIDLKEKFAEVCKHEGGEVTNMKDGSVACELGGNKIKLSGFADYVEIEREIFNDEPHVKLALYGLEDIIPNNPSDPDEHMGWLIGEKDDERWSTFIRWGMIWFSSGGITGSFSY